MRFFLIILFTVSTWAQLPWQQHYPYSDWTPPPGIPMPSFGITNSHWMYHPFLGPATYDYGSGAVAYRTNEYGPYTHYIDNTHGSATDTGNSFGTPSTPRLTWPNPSTLAPGSVVMVAGGGTYTFSNTGTGMAFGGPGTQASPNHFVAVGATTNIADRPKINRGEDSGVLPWGTWTMFSWFIFTNDSQVWTRADLYTHPISNISVRGCIAIGSGTTDTDDQFFAAIGQSSANYSRNMVLFTNTIAKYGNYTNATENDACGFIAREYSTNWWILANTIYEMGGDAGRIGSNEDNNNDNCLTGFHYIGGNDFFRNGENAVDVKKANRAVIAGNRFHDFREYVPSGGDAVISQHYNPNYIWYINNEFYDANLGLSTGSRMQVTNETWVVGNVFRDLDDSAIYWRGQFTNFFYNNTMARVARGVEVTDDGSPQMNVRMTNNIVYEPTVSLLHFANSVSRPLTSIGYENYYDTTGLDIEWGVNYSSIATWDAAAGNAGNILSYDPLFTDAGNNDYTLSASSQLINAGFNVIPQMEAAFLAQFGFALNYRDINGNSRGVDGGVDVGAFEYLAAFIPTAAIGRGSISGGATIK